MMSRYRVLCAVLLIGCVGCDDSATEPKPTPKSPTDMHQDMPVMRDSAVDLDLSKALDMASDLATDMPIKTCEQRLNGQSWSVCVSESQRCDIVFEDGTGCLEACKSLGMMCANAFDDVPKMCAKNTDLPELGCVDTGHQSDYCVCTTTGQVGTDMGQPDMMLDMSQRPKHEALLDELVGFGEGTTGGAGGPVVAVTSLADSGPGTLREAAQIQGAAWIRFMVSGTIVLKLSLIHI